MKYGAELKTERLVIGAIRVAETNVFATVFRIQ